MTLAQAGPPRGQERPGKPGCGLRRVGGRLASDGVGAADEEDEEA